MSPVVAQSGWATRGCLTLPRARSRVPRVRDARLQITLGTGLIAGLAALGFTLSQSPLVVERVSTQARATIGDTSHRLSACQPGEALPARTSAIRLRAIAFLGPRVTVDVLAHGRVIAHGERGTGWTGGAVTVPVSSPATSTSGTSLCFTLFTNGDEHVELAGARTTAAPDTQIDDGALHGRLGVEYLRPGSSSWFSLARAVARRMGLGRGWPGTWSVPLALALMGSAVLTCAALMARALR